jgi:peptide/nickel transport system substrate-binding protein
MQEALAEMGITVNIEKVPSANFRSVLVEKSRPMIVNNFGGWLNYPDYFFFYAYHGQDATFNGSSYKNPEMDEDDRGGPSLCEPGEPSMRKT